MATKQLEAFLTRALGPSLSTIIITALIALSLPLLLHLYLYKTRKALSLPSFLLVGPSGSGKTALLTLFERGTPATTHTSQSSLTVECSLPTAVDAAARYRSANDTSIATKKFLLADHPGHGKLRHLAMESIMNPLNLRGIIFVVDASTLTVGVGSQVSQMSAANATGAANYLYEVLLILQKRFTESKTSLGPQAMPVMIAANKSDLFTALPAQLVRSTLEAELTKIRDTRVKALPDSGIDLDRSDAGGERDWLGSQEDGGFRFAQMEEFNISVDIIAGSVTSGEAAHVEQWWKWIGEHI